MPAPDALVSKLARAYGLSGLVPVEDERVRRLLQGAAEALAGGERVEFWVSEGWIQGPEGPLGSPEDLTGELARDLEIAGVSTVSLPAGLSVDALATFVGHLREGSGSGDGSHSARTLAHELPEIGVEFSDEGARGWGPARSLDRLFATGPQAAPAPTGEAPAPEAPEGKASVSPPGETLASEPAGDGAASVPDEEAAAPVTEAPSGPAEEPAAEPEERAAELEVPAPEPETPAEPPEPEVPEPAEGLSEPAEASASSAPGAEAQPSPSAEGPPGAAPPAEETRESIPEEDTETAEAPSEAEPAAAEATPTGAAPGPGVEVEAEDAEEGPELGALVAAYLQAASGERGSVAERIRARAEALRQDGVFDELAAAVQDLARAGIEDTGDGAALELAREILVTGAATRIALDLGQIRDEEEREAMIGLVSRLGQTMAAPISEALVDASDRSARRAYIEAMVALGSAVEEQVLGMVEDSRWFVVRNGVAILGRIGDDRSIEHLTSTLAHEDLRVRRETVLALAKLGGENAAALALGMIDDPEPEVRAATAMALGELEVEKAVRPLRKRLEEEEDEDVQVQILRALGQLGDPGAVPEIEKRAVSSFFSRSPRPVRIAAYKALSEIGTPHAVKLLEKALDDKDTEVRVAVRGMLKSLEEAKEAGAGA